MDHEQVEQNIVDDGDSLAERLAQYNENKARMDQRQKPVKDVFEQRLKADRSTEDFAYAVLEACYAHREHMQIVNDVLFYKGRPFKVSGENVRSLANTPRTVTTATARWVYDNLKRLVPKTDETLMEIMPGVVWNSRIVRFVMGEDDD